MLDIYKIIKNTTVEGPGVRFCIWVQGCKKRCKGCWAKETWAFDVGTKYSVEQLFDLILLEKENIEGITFLGGEPFEQAVELAKLAKKVHEIGLSVVCFSGYTYDELKLKKSESVDLLLKYTDLLVDGEFDQAKFDLSRPWVGSSNQRYIFLTDKYSESEILQFKNKIEARIMLDGRVEVNGMGDFKKINSELCLQLGKNKVK